METEVMVPPWQRPEFSTIWKCPAPSKVSAFAWQLLHDRIPTRINLQRRQIIDVTGDVSCVHCGGAVESSQHLFIYCVDALKIWSAVFDWLQVPLMFPQNLFSILSALSHSKGKKVRKGMTMIWNGVVWAIWRRWNAVIFDSGNKGVQDVIEEIKVVTWRWWLSQSKASQPLLYEWQMEPIVCMES
jgi:hypothetical protein